MGDIVHLRVPLGDLGPGVGEWGARHQLRCDSVGALGGGLEPDERPPRSMRRRAWAHALCWENALRDCKCTTAQAGTGAEREKGRPPFSATSPQQARVLVGRCTRRGREVRCGGEEEVHSGIILGAAVLASGDGDGTPRLSKGGAAREFVTCNSSLYASLVNAGQSGIRSRMSNPTLGHA